MTKPLVAMRHINKTFFTDDIETLALNDIHFSVNAGEFVAITGPSGCGKSTLLSVLGLLDHPSSGEYIFTGDNTTQWDHKACARKRNRDIGFVFQAFNLISDLSVEENVALPLSYRDDLSRAERAERVSTMLTKVDMSHRAKHYPSQLSGGQQQRVAIARALAGNPSLLLADEPTGNLDSRNAEIVIQLLHQLHKEGATIIMVTHDAHLASSASRQVAMFDGRIVNDTHATSTFAPQGAIDHVV